MILLFLHGDFFPFENPLSEGGKLYTKYFGVHDCITVSFILQTADCVDDSLLGLRNDSQTTVEWSPN